MGERRERKLSYPRRKSGAPERSSATVARSRETLTATVTSGLAVSTEGRMPRRACSWSTMASLEWTAVNCVFLSWAFVPCASIVVQSVGVARVYAAQHKHHAGGQARPQACAVCV